MMETTNTVQKFSEKSKKKYRAPWEKEGIYECIQKILRRIEDKLDDVRRTQRYEIKGLDLASYLVFDRNYVHDTVCINEVDTIILEELHNAGEDGILPRDIANTVNKLMHTRRFQPWHVRYILRRMNRKLEQQIGERIAEKRGMRWALTCFARKAWNLTKEVTE